MTLHYLVVINLPSVSGLMTHPALCIDLFSPTKTDPTHVLRMSWESDENKFCHDVESILPLYRSISLSSRHCCSTGHYICKGNRGSKNLEKVTQKML
jgi:hypothetical protein